MVCICIRIYCTVNQIQANSYVFLCLSIVLLIYNKIIWLVISTFFTNRLPPRKWEQIHSDAILTAGSKLRCNLQIKAVRTPVILNQKFHLNAHFQACKMHINNKPILPLPLMSEMSLGGKRWKRDLASGDIFSQSPCFKEQEDTHLRDNN